MTCVLEVREKSSRRSGVCCTGKVSVKLHLELYYEETDTCSGPLWVLGTKYIWLGTFGSAKMEYSSPSRSLLLTIKAQQTGHNTTNKHRKTLKDRLKVDSLETLGHEWQHSTVDSLGFLTASHIARQDACRNQNHQ